MFRLKWGIIVILLALLASPSLAWVENDESECISNYYWIHNAHINATWTFTDLDNGTDYVPDWNLGGGAIPGHGYVLDEAGGRAKVIELFDADVNTGSDSRMTSSYHLPQSAGNISYWFRMHDPANELNQGSTMGLTILNVNNDVAVGLVLVYGNGSFGAVNIHSQLACAENEAASQTIVGSIVKDKWHYVNIEFDNGSPTYNVTLDDNSPVECTVYYAWGDQGVNGIELKTGPEAYFGSGSDNHFIWFDAINYDWVSDNNISIGQCCGNDGTAQETFYNGTLGGTTAFCYQGSFIKGLDYSDGLCTAYGYSFIHGYIPDSNVYEDFESFIDGDNILDSPDWTSIGSVNTNIFFKAYDDAGDMVGRFYDNDATKFLLAYGAFGSDGYFGDRVTFDLKVITPGASSSIVGLADPTGTARVIMAVVGSNYSAVYDEVTFTELGGITGDWDEISFRAINSTSWDVSINGVLYGPFDNYLGGAWSSDAIRTVIIGTADTSSGADTFEAYINNISATWTHEINYSCCGDDGLADNFYNGTLSSTKHFCHQGSFINEEIDRNKTLCEYRGYDWLTGFPIIEDFETLNLGDIHGQPGLLGTWAKEAGGQSAVIVDVGGYLGKILRKTDWSSTQWVHVHLTLFTNGSAESGKEKVYGDEIVKWVWNKSTSDSNSLRLGEGANFKVQYAFYLESGEYKVRHLNAGDSYVDTGLTFELGVEETWEIKLISRTQTRIRKNGGDWKGPFNNYGSWGEGEVISRVSFMGAMSANPFYDVHELSVSWIRNGGNCCGDDLLYDNFYNGTISSTEYFCYLGTFTQQTIDSNQSLCEYWGFDWLTGDITGDYGRCCGDDGVLDNFHNGSHYCIDGVYVNEPDAYEPICTYLGHDWVVDTDFSESWLGVANNTSMNGVETPLGSWLVQRDESNRHLRKMNVSDEHYLQLMGASGVAWNSTLFFNESVSTGGGDTFSLKTYVAAGTANNYWLFGDAGNWLRVHFGGVTGSNFTFYNGSQNINTDKIIPSGEWFSLEFEFLSNSTYTVKFNDDYVRRVDTGSEILSNRETFTGNVSRFTIHADSGTSQNSRWKEFRASWIYYTPIGSYNPCCGDDGVLDNFSNGTHYCIDGGLYSDPNVDEPLCTYLGHEWFTGDVTGDYGSCCGDDGLADNFYNGTIGSTTHFCHAGNYLNQGIDLNKDVCEYYSYKWINYSTGLIDAFHFDEGSGATTYGEGGASAPTAGSSWISGGKYGSALNFTGSSGIQTTNLSLDNNFTISFWIKPTALYNSGETISAGDLGAYLSFITYADGHMLFGIGTGTLWGNLTITSAGELTNGVWYHIAGTYNSTHTRLYINGVIKGTKLNTGYTLNQPLNFGYREGGTPYYFKGAIDEVLIFNRALTPDEVVTHYKSSPYFGCCGDDGLADNFYNGTIGDTTYFCQDGSLIRNWIDNNQSLCTAYNYNWINNSHYPATYSFTDDIINGSPAGWTIGGITENSTVRVVDNFLGRGKVVLINDSSAHTHPTLQNTYEDRLNGTIQFWYAYNDASLTNSYGVLINNRTGWLNIYFVLNEDNIIWYTDIPSWLGGPGTYVSFSAPFGRWHHVKVDFNTRVDKANLTLNGALVGINLNYASNNTSDDPFYRIAFSSSNPSLSNLYIDAVDYSWNTGLTNNDSIASCCGDDLTYDYFLNDSRAFGSICYYGDYYYNNFDQSQANCEAQGWTWLNNSHYPANYSFTNDASDLPPSSIEYTEADLCTVLVKDEHLGHGKVVLVNDTNTTSGNCGITMRSITGTSGSISWWMSVLNNGWFGVDFRAGDTANIGTLFLMRQHADTNFRYYTEGTYFITAIDALKDGDWHHWNLTWTPTNYTLYVDGVLVLQPTKHRIQGAGSRLAFSSSLAASSYQPLFYVDALDYSGHTGGDNTIAPCCGDDGALDTFSNGTHYCLEGSYLSDPDISEASCTGLSYDWFTGSVTGNYPYCCGDDGVLDNFYNGTIGSTQYFCHLGSFTEQTIDSNQTLCEYYDYDWIPNAGNIIFNPDASSGVMAPWVINSTSQSFEINGNYFATNYDNPTARYLAGYMIQYFNTPRFHDGNLSFYTFYCTYSEGGFTDNLRVTVTYDDDSTLINMPDQQGGAGVWLYQSIALDTNKAIKSLKFEAVNTTGQLCGIDNINLTLGGNKSCCGDDLLLDNFYNGTIGSTQYFCYLGRFTEQPIDYNQTLCEYWGYDWFTGDIPIHSNYSLSAGQRHTCVLINSGNVTCWGSSTFSKTVPYLGGDAVTVASSDYNCVLKSDGNVYCWGSNVDNRTNPYLGGDAVDMDIGVYHSCVLRSNGDVACWGRNTDGQSANYSLGDGVGIATGWDHSCVLTVNGDVACWGVNTYGQSANYTQGDGVAVSAGGYHSCVLTTGGDVACWGVNTYGQSNPYLGGDAVAVSAGGHHTCVLTTGGDVACWGRNDYGQSNPYLGGDAVAVSVGGMHSCVLRYNGDVACWGSNADGQSEPYLDGDAYLNYASCCGDDVTNEYFYNGTIGSTQYFCHQGEYINEPIDAHQDVCEHWGFDWIPGFATDEYVDEDFSTYSVNDNIITVSPKWFGQIDTGNYFRAKLVDGVMVGHLNDSITNGGIYPHIIFDHNATLTRGNDYFKINFKALNNELIEFNLQSELQTLNGLVQIRLVDGDIIQYSGDLAITTGAKYSLDTWHELIIFLPDESHHYIKLDGVYYGINNNSGLGWNNRYNFTLGVGLFKLVSYNLYTPDYYFDNLTASWTGVSSCCGDDGLADIFYNGTINDTSYFCHKGVFTEQPIDYNQTLCEYWGYDWFTSDGTFADRVPHTTGTQPYRVAVGDFDGDGWLDFVTADSGSNHAGVFLNNGDGTFAVRVPYATVSQPRGVAVGDFDGDGWLDLVISGDSKVRVYFNDGDGTFTLNSEYSGGSNSHGVAVGDFDGDGWLDFVTVDTGSNQAGVFINDGDGTFAARVPYTTGTTPAGVAVGDFDGDGWLDFVTVDTGSNQAGVFLNNGDGTFAARVPYTTGIIPRGVAVGDFDGDGWLDFVTVDVSSNQAGVFLNNGDGTFAVRVPYTTSAGPSGVAVGDFDGDGWLDFVTVDSSSNRTGVFLNDGDGTFASRVSYTTGSTSYGVAVGDFNGDNLLDFVTADSGSNQAGVFKNKGLTGLYSQCCGDDLTYDNFFNGTIGTTEHFCHYGAFINEEIDNNQAICEYWGNSWINSSETHPATYSFTLDEAGTHPINWTVDDAGGVIQVVSGINGHDKVVELSTTNEGSVGMYNNFFDYVPVSSPYTVSFWVRPAQTDKELIIWLDNDQLRPMLVYIIAEVLFAETGYIKVGENNLQTYSANTWYHINVTESGSNYYVNVNGNHYGPYAKSSSESLTAVEFITGYQEDALFYIDAVNYSWMQTSSGTGFENCCGDDPGEDWVGSNACCCNGKSIVQGMVCDNDESFTPYGVCDNSTWCNSTIAPVITLSDKVINPGASVTVTVNSECMPNLVVINPNLTETTIIMDSCGTGCYETTLAPSEPGYYHLQAFNGQYSHSMFLVKNSSLIWQNEWVSADDEIFKYKINLSMTPVSNNSIINHLITYDYEFNNPTYCQDVNADGDYNDLVDKLGLRIVNALPNGQYYETPYSISNVTCTGDNNLTRASIHFPINLPANSSPFNRDGNVYAIYHSPTDYNVKPYNKMISNETTPVWFINNSAFKIELSPVNYHVIGMYDLLGTSNELDDLTDLGLKTLQYNDGSLRELRTGVSGTELINTVSHSTHSYWGVMNGNPAGVNITIPATYYFTVTENLTFNTGASVNWLKYFEAPLNRTRFTHAIINESGVIINYDLSSHSRITKTDLDWIIFINKETNDGIGFFKTDSWGATNNPLYEINISSSLIKFSYYPIGFSSRAVGAGESYGGEFHFTLINNSRHNYKIHKEIHSWFNEPPIIIEEEPEVAFDIVSYRYDHYVDKSDENITLTVKAFTSENAINAVQLDINDSTGAKVLSEQFDCVSISDFTYECNWTKNPLMWACRTYNAKIYAVGDSGNTTEVHYSFEIDDLIGTYEIADKTLIGTNQTFIANYEYCSGKSAPLDDLIVTLFIDNSQALSTNASPIGRVEYSYTNPITQGQKVFNAFANDSNYWDNYTYSANIYKSHYSLHPQTQAYYQGRAGYRSAYVEVRNPTINAHDYTLIMIPSGITARFSQNNKREINTVIPPGGRVFFYFDVLPVSSGIFNINFNTHSEMLIDNASMTYTAIIQTTYSTGLFTYVLASAWDWITILLMLIVVSFAVYKKA